MRKSFVCYFPITMFFKTCHILCSWKKLRNSEFVIISPLNISALYPAPKPIIQITAVERRSEIANEKSPPMQAPSNMLISLITGSFPALLRSTPTSKRRSSTTMNITITATIVEISDERSAPTLFENCSTISIGAPSPLWKYF